MPLEIPRCQVVPLDSHQVAFRVDGAERTRWHFGPQYPRPFLFPVRGPNGAELTRMGHPGAPNHDHHRSVWFAHHEVVGIDFWSDRSPATIRQPLWLAYEDGDREALMAVRLTWHDGHDPKELLQQELLVSVRPAADDQRETLIEFDTTFHPVAEQLEFGQTNFGFLAVRMAAELSAHFGNGQLTNDAGEQTEQRLFGKRSRWMDYSGQVRGPGGPEAAGIAFFDHPGNPGHPTPWHVREDGWMGAAACLDGPLLTTRQQPLRLRYLLHAHGAYQPAAAERLAAQFADSPPLELLSARSLGVKHRQYLLRRRDG